MENNTPPTELMPIRPPGENPFKVYFSTLYALLTRPTAFFKTVDSGRSIAFALTFAVVTHWIGAALGYLWQSALGRVISSRFSDRFQIFDQMSAMAPSGQMETLNAWRERAYHWTWGTGSVLIDPFKTIISILLGSFFVWIASRILAEKNTRFETAVTIISFGTAPAILQGVPLVGPLLASIFVFIVTMIGARELYRVTSGRAMVIVLFPEILLGIVVLAALGLVLYFFSSLIMSIFSF